MKRMTLVLAALMLISSTVGCGCCRRLRDRLCRGAYCGPAAAVAPAAVASPGLLAPPAVPVQTPVQQPVMAPAPMMIAPRPMTTNCVPCDPCYVPCDPCDPCGGYGYYGAGYPTGGVYDSGWSDGCGCSSSGSSGSDYYPESAPAPAGGNPDDPAPRGSEDRGA